MEYTQQGEQMSLWLKNKITDELCKYNMEEEKPDTKKKKKKFVYKVLKKHIKTNLWHKM